MANEVGTASNLEDLFGKIISFLTTNSALVAANQDWIVNRQFRDGVAGMTTNLTESTSAASRKILHSFRYTPRSLNTNNPNTTDGYTQCTGYTSGTSYIALTLRSAREIKNVRMWAPNSSDVSTMLQNFRLQYSDDNSSWTTALTVNSNPTYAQNEMKDFAVPGTPGAHVYWRILVDRVQSGFGSTVTWRSLLLQLADGTIANHFSSEALLKAPGNSGTESIYTGIRCEYDAGNGWYNLFLMGYTGYDANVLDFFQQPGALSGYGDVNPMFCPMVPCWNTSMPYWFAATGRSFRFGVKVSTSFEGGYLGFFLPYATPGQYPYPLAVGGSMIPQNGARGVEWRYSYNDYRHSVFPTPAATSPSAQFTDATLYMRLPDGTWRSAGQRATTSNPNTITRMTMNLTSPFAASGPAIGVWPTCVHSTTVGDGCLPYREVLGGGYILQPLILLQRLPALAVWGELEGVFSISGFSNSAENTTTFGGTNHTVFQNVARTEVQEYWALALPA